MTVPLAGVRVLAFEQFGAGPWATLQLADLGADVVKIEDPTAGGDVGRYVPPFQDGEDSLFFETFNRGKRSLSLDLRHSLGRDVLEDLVRAADVVFSNLRGDQPEKLRLRYDDLKQVNPRIVCCSLSGFGMTGPRAAEAGYDYVVQGLAGWMSLTGEPDGPPAKSGLSRASPTSRHATGTATPCLPSWTRRSRLERRPTGWLSSPPPASRRPRSMAWSRRSRIRRRWHEMRSSRRSTSVSAPSGRSRRRWASAPGGHTPTRAPHRGEHNDEVLAELCGYDAARIAKLAHAGAFGDAIAPETTVTTGQA